MNTFPSSDFDVIGKQLHSEMDVQGDATLSGCEVSLRGGQRGWATAKKWATWATAKKWATNRAEWATLLRLTGPSPAVHHSTGPPSGNYIQSSIATIILLQYLNQLEYAPTARCDGRCSDTRGASQGVATNGMRSPVVHALSSISICQFSIKVKSSN